MKKNESAGTEPRRRSKTAGSKRDEFVGDPGKTVEDYLEAILIVRERQGYVRSVDVAEQLEVSKPSVTYVTKRLKSQGYIDTDHAGMLLLTEEGEKIASSTYDRLFCRAGDRPEAGRDRRVQGRARHQRGNVPRPLRACQSGKAE